VEVNPLMFLYKPKIVI